MSIPSREGRVSRSNVDVVRLSRWAAPFESCGRAELARFDCSAARQGLGMTELCALVRHLQDRAQGVPDKRRPRRWVPWLLGKQPTHEGKGGFASPLALGRHFTRRSRGAVFWIVSRRVFAKTCA